MKPFPYIMSLMSNNEIDTYWGEIEGVLDKVQHLWADRWSKDFLYQAAQRGMIGIWTVGTDKGFSLLIFTQVARYPLANVLEVFLTIGSGIQDMLPIISATLDKFAKDCECVDIEVTGREGWGKLLPHLGAVKVSTTWRRSVPQHTEH